MLEIKALYKNKRDTIINNINLSVKRGELVSVECSDSVSDMLIDLIVNEEISGDGEIYIDNMPNEEYLKKNRANVAIMQRESSLYERLTVSQYLKFFSEVVESKIDYKYIMTKLSLVDVENETIKKLDLSKRKILSLARELLKQPKLFIFQDPLFYVDKESKRIILKVIDELVNNNVAVLVLSMSYKEAVLIGGKVYILNDEGLTEESGKKKMMKLLQ